MVIDASGFVDWYWRWRRFVILFLSFAGFQRVEVLGKEFDVVSGASSCLAAAAVDDLAVRQDPLTDSGNAVGEMIFHGIAEKVAIRCEDVGLHEVEHAKVAFNLRCT